MSLLDTLTPRTVTVTGARLVDLGSNKDSWSDEQKERRLYRNMSDADRLAYHREAKQKHRDKVKAYKLRKKAERAI